MSLDLLLLSQLLDLRQIDVSLESFSALLYSSLLSSSQGRK